MSTFADTVRIAPRFTRAIRVEADLLARSALDGFVCSASSAALLRSLARQYAEGRQRAFTVTGTYGSGKSSLAVALACLVGRDPGSREAARDVLGRELSEEVVTALGVKQGYAVVPVAGQRGDAAEVIGAALAHHLPEGAGRRPRGVSGGLLDRLTAAARRPDVDGVLLIIDEMGKLLEAVAAGEGDVHLLQEIAEAAARSDGRLVVVGLLHSAFDDYANRLGATARREWLKVQGRFADLPLQIGLEEQIDILARAIEAPTRPEANKAAARAVADEVCRARLEGAEVLTARLHGCWPLEPVAAVLLSALARRGLGQAQRSLFAFLTSAEPRGFRDVLASRQEGDARGYAAEDLWDYLVANRGIAQIGAAEAGRFALGLDAIDRCVARGGGAEHLAILKTVALIDLLREVSGVRATPGLLAAATPSLAADGLGRVLADLTAWSVLVHRRHVGAYAMFAGSDLDLDVLVAAARGRLAGVDLKRLNAIAALPPFVAKRHHEETGALRWFPVEVVALADAAARLSQVATRSDAAGLVLVALPLAGEGPRVARRLWREAAERAVAAPVALGLPRDASRIRELAQELLALELVRAETPELAGDAAARREVTARHAGTAADLEAALREAAAGADWIGLVPGMAPFALEAGSSSALTAAASRLADATFPLAPRLRNDLLNRSEPSSQAVAARRALLHAMVESPGKPLLGFKGYPAERGLHASLLERTGLHVPVGEGEGWRFAEPADDAPARLRPLWDAADAALRRSDVGVSVGTLHDLWAVKPYGVRAGLLPVLAVAYLLSRRDAVAVSLDGSFVPTPGAFFVDRMLQDPAAVTLRWSEANGARNAWFAAVAQVLADLDAGGVSDDPAPLDVARRLFAFVAGLPPWTLRTARVGTPAQRLRVVVRKATDPLALLLDQIPALLGGQLLTAEDARHMASALAAELRALREAYPGLIVELADTVEREFKVAGAGGLPGLRERASAVRGLTGNLRLDALSVHLEGYEGAQGQIEALTALAAHKPAQDWTDRDVDVARLGLAELAQAFLRAEALAHVKGRADTAETLAVISSTPGSPGPLLVEVRLPRAAEAQAGALQAWVESALVRNGATYEAQVAALARALARLVAQGSSGSEERRAE